MVVTCVCRLQLASSQQHVAMINNDDDDEMFATRRNQVRGGYKA